MSGPCHYCGTLGDNRPYGPDGAWLCFPCLKSSPAIEAEAGRQFTAQLVACAPIAVIGEETGPRPLIPGVV